MSQSRQAAIAGIHEYPLRVAPGVSAMQIKAASLKAALDDAGLKWSDVDGLYDAGDGEGGGGLGLAAYLGLKPRVIDTTQVGGSSYEFHTAHALRDIAAGRVRVAVTTYGSTAASSRMAIGTGGRFGGASWQTNMEAPYGSTLISNYAMVKQRHMHQYGTTNEQLAEISVATRKHAMRNPEAVKAMTDLQFVKVDNITVADVLESRVVATPLRLLECCMVSDGGGALVIVSPEVARDIKKKPVWVIGSGEATKYRENGGDITVSAGAQSGPAAFAQAGVTPSEIDIAMIYDSFTITVATCLEDLGFCKKGEVGAFIGDGHLAFDKPGLTINTDGGGLSSNHPGMRGLFLLLEATRQLRGESTSQVNGAKLAVAHGNGGLLGATHTGGTVVLAAD
ncbi:MAG: thiolase domain-containing protein [Dehalococcoidia bacterium]|uniref:thiolase C-terminal domain-containing protein n=1 Tax=Candidatus Amarobacter glycogenicus TaxID=3140699 RepID=UPI003134FDEF|nr:thiolase domain-containing protein [Dehalococcoidia bacterium]MBK7127410.1 thiolase domain-containing protein [Dehalococcoidia bacterium]MBK8561086.1 thiolase domain-containing protein [Dehalococcoidia bacterium]MBK9546181.1 thiolase domain-containing protein [Dehalococcoidia bacterium]